MAKSWFCEPKNQKIDHSACRGTVVMGAPGPLAIEKCKCDCHKAKK